MLKPEIAKAVKAANETAGYARFGLFECRADGVEPGTLTLTISAEFARRVVRTRDYTPAEFPGIPADLQTQAARYVRQRDKIRAKHGA